MRNRIRQYCGFSFWGILLLLIPVMSYGQELDKKSQKELHVVSKEYNNKDYQSANEIINNLLKQYPNNTDVLYWKAKLSCSLGDINVAKENYQKAINMLESEVDDLEFETSKKAMKEKEIIKQKIIEFNKEKGECEAKISRSPKKANGTMSSRTSSGNGTNNAKPFPKNKISVNNVETSRQTKSPKASVKRHSFNKPAYTANTPGSKWHPFVKHDKKSQLDELKEFISKYYQKNKENLNQSYETIINTSHSWIKNNAFKQYEWFDNLEMKEQQYRESTDRYDSCVRAKIKIVNEIKIAKNDSIGVLNKLRIAREDSASFADIYNSVLKDELMTKLSTIPQSIVLVGRIAEVSNESKSKRLMRLMNAMTDIAIKSVNGYTIITQRFSNNSDLSSMYSLSSEGIAETVDKYYKSLVINPNDKDKLFFYEIYRIEVFPFNKNIKNAKTSTEQLNNTNNATPFNADINVYVPNIVGDTIKSLNEKTIEDNRVIDGKVTTLKDHKLDGERNADVRDFIKMISKTSNDFNNEYNKRIEAAINDYKLKRQEYLGKITLVQQKIGEILNEKRSIADTLVSLKKQKQDLIGLLNGRIRDDYVKAKHNYEDFYETKNQLVNQLAVKSIDNISNGIEGGFINLSQESYNSIVSNLQKRYNKTTVFRETHQNQDKDIIGLEKSEIRYTPELDSFKVLSMIKYNKNELTYLSLNIAFNVKWKIINQVDSSLNNTGTYSNLKNPGNSRKDTVTQSTVTALNTETEANTEEPSGQASSTGSVSQFGQSPSIDTASQPGQPPTQSPGISWRILKVNITFSDYLYGNKNGNESLPTLEQLKDIIKDSRFRKKIKEAEGNNSIIVIPTSETYYNDDDFKVHRGLILNLFDFNSSVGAVGEGDVVTVVVTNEKQN